MFTTEQTALLSAKLDPSHVKQREQSGRRLSYIEGWHAIAEANRIFGFGCWARETLELRCVSEKPRKVGKDGADGWGVSYVAKCRVTVFGVVREGYGAGHGIDRDLGLAHESAAKEAETDAMKRCLMTFGNPFGLALYDKKQEGVGYDEPLSSAANDAPPATDADRLTYATAFKAQLQKCSRRFDVEKAWTNAAKKRADLGITPGTDDYDRLTGFCRDRLEEIGLPNEASAA